MQLKERKKSNTLPIIILSVLLAAVIGVSVWLAVWVVKLNTMSDLHNAQTENAYEDALFQTADGLNAVENDLAKLMVTKSASMSAMYAADICKCAAEAADASARLPVSYEDTAKLQKFLNQVSDFAAVYIRVSAEGGDLEKYDDQIEVLYKTAKALKDKVSGLTAKFDGSYNVMDRIDTDGFYADLSGGESDSSVEYPRIIYDGPFSDSIDDLVFKAADGMPELTEQEAVTIAAENYGLQKGSVVDVTGESARVYQLLGEIDGREAYVGLTVNGGLLANLSVTQTTGGVKYGQDYASEFAVDKCLEYGFCKHLAPVWYNSIGAVAYVNLAPVIEDIIYYTDLVKVTVNLTDGTLMGIEAREYCCNYCKRDAAAVMNENAVPTLVSSKLNVRSIRLAVIPKGRSEVLCYEVAADLNGLDYFIYLDAVKGTEVEILRVIDEDQGAMVY